MAATKKGVVVEDPDGVPSVGPPCEGGYPESSAVVTCPRRKVDLVVVDLGDGDDSFDGDGDVRFKVDGDADDDEIDGGDARDLLEGKFGDDSLDGSEGSDSLLGGLGDDRLSGKAGKDLLDGGPGSDRGNGGAGKNRCYGVEKATACTDRARAWKVPKRRHDLR